jgi:prepilin-type N-terminal cleavage/methylation domain-containing protein
LIKRLQESEAGYSLVEVMVAILILLIAIIPMVGMFDVGLRSATTGGNYDRARMLANANLEKVLSMPYADAQAAYPPENAAPSPGTPVACDESIFDCRVTTTYVNDALSPNSAATTKMRVRVEVEWDGQLDNALDNGTAFTTTGLKAR